MWLIGLVLAGLLVLTASAWPRVGLLARWKRLRDARQRVLVEDALKHLHACEWRGHPATPDSLAGALRLSSRTAINLIARMEALGWLRSAADGLRLMPDGEQLALQVIRAHRLWERYLADEARMALTDVHAEAERREHAHSAEALQALADAMGHPVTDPHGDPIPTAQGLLARPVVQSVTAWPLNLPARIVHLEDEPQTVFAQIAAEGLRPGQVVRVLEANARRVILSDGERTYTLAPVVAANIFVGPEVRPAEPSSARRLTALRRGQRAIVRELDESLQGFTRRRLLDLGLTPGTPITAELPSLFGDPVAYRVRGTLIALRRDQAENILITDHGSDHD